MLGLTRLLDRVTLPGAVVIGMGILPPPHFVRCAVASHDQIEITVAVNIEENSSGLDVERTRIDDMLLPPRAQCSASRLRRCRACGW